MMRFVLVLVSGTMLTACGRGSSTPASPTPATSAPAPTLYTLSGQVVDNATAAPIAGATLSITDGVNAGKTATTDASGSYSLTGLQVSGFTVNVAAGAYVSSGQGVTLTASRSLNFGLTQQSFVGNWSGTTTQGSINGLPSITFTVNGTNALTALNMRFASASSC